jgi:hypothetical protein
MSTQLILGGIVFQNYDYSPPSHMPFGGNQAMVVHKLPGGSRVIDTLGPDEADISWSGFFFANTALQQCQTLDALRAAGKVVTLTFAGMSRQVVIKNFLPKIRRFPNWVDYEISCTVSANPAFGATSAAPDASAISVISAATNSDLLIASDLARALAASVQ